MNKVKASLSHVRERGRMGLCQPFFFPFSVCGSRPWFENKKRVAYYPQGVRNGVSEARIGSKPKRTPFSLTSEFNSRQGRFLWSLGGRGGLNRDARIVNGKTADYGEWPWQISLRQWRTGGFFLRALSKSIDTRH